MYDIIHSSQKNKHKDRHVQEDGHLDTHTDGHMDIWKDKDKLSYKQTCGQMDRHSNRWAFVLICLPTHEYKAKQTFPQTGVSTGG